MTKVANLSQEMEGFLTTSSPFRLPQHSQSRSRFMILPAEIRSQILEILLVSTGPLDPRLGRSTMYGLSPQILRTCQGLCQEGSVILYEQNTLGILWEYNRFTDSICWILESKYKLDAPLDAARMYPVSTDPLCLVKTALYDQMTGEVNLTSKQRLQKYQIITQFRKIQLTTGRPWGDSMSLPILVDGSLPFWLGDLLIGKEVRFKALKQAVLGAAPTTDIVNYESCRYLRCREFEILSDNTEIDHVAHMRSVEAEVTSQSDVPDILEDWRCLVGIDASLPAAYHFRYEFLYRRVMECAQSYKVAEYTSIRSYMVMAVKKLARQWLVEIATRLARMKRSRERKRDVLKQLQDRMKIEKGCEYLDHLLARGIQYRKY